MFGKIVKPEKEKAKGIAKQSDKRKVDQKAYRKIVKEMLAENKNCMVKAPGCTKIAQGLHHVVKRSPKNLLDKTNLLPCCNFCNSFLENNDAWGRERGFVKSKYK